MRYEIPKTLDERMKIRNLIREQVATMEEVPPLPLSALQRVASQLISEHQLPESYKEWMMVEVHNQAWLPFVSRVPFERRLLLLPKCLSSSAHCQADVDELGLLCRRCGRCSILGLEDYAAQLGMMSLVAEGFGSVVDLIKQGAIDCVIGVSCLDSLEKAFPLLIGNAIPGLAIPLNYDGCKDTEVDEAYLRSVMSQRDDDEVFLMDYGRLRDEVEVLFAPERLQQVKSHDETASGLIAFRWMSRHGKRWRPYLLAATYCALKGENKMSLAVELAAVGVECFHKASLVHDDIQDDDDLRYGEPTVHHLHGVPMAINVGDALLGEGYRLFAQCGSLQAIEAVAAAHLALCRGQGMEMEWCASPQPLTMDLVLDISRHKTVPAFEVSMQLGRALAGIDPNPLGDIIHRYSEALGIAYQLLDDISDYEDGEPTVVRPTAVLAVLQSDPAIGIPEALDTVRSLAEQYRQQALDVLQEVRNVELKRLLFRITEKILKN